MPSSYDFNVSLFEMGDTSMCLFSYCCFPCAVAQSRTNMDGSNFLMNLMSLRCVTARWLIRSTYHIPGEAFNDCLVACFCPCCSANQLYQTTQLRGNPTPDGGAHHNLGDFKTQLGAGNARSCLYSTCCLPCAVGTIMESTMGMPWWLGCCCVDVWMARNLVRYQNRIKGNDLVEECAIPYGLICIGNLLGNVIPCASCIVHGMFVVLGMQLLEETQMRAMEQEAAADRSFRRPERVSHHGYTILGREFSSFQGDYYLQSPSALPAPSAPVAEQLMHVMGGAREILMTPTIVQGHSSTYNPVAQSQSVQVQPGAVMYSPPMMQVIPQLQQQQNRTSVDY